MNWEKAISKALSRVGWDDEAKRMVAYSRMRTVAILKVRELNRCRQWKRTDHGLICVIARHTKTRLNVH